MGAFDDLIPSSESQPSGAFDDLVPAKKPKKTERDTLDVIKDAGITALKGAIGLPEAVVGLADIPTGGRVGKALDEAGFRPAEAKQILDEYLSDPQKEANRKVQEAEGFVDTTIAALQNPSTIATTVGESVPQMLGGAGLARGFLKVAPKIGAVAAGALGEGLIGAGAAAESIRNETEDGLLTGKQAGVAAATGVSTAALGALGGKIAQKLGVSDVDTLLAEGGAVAGKSAKGFVRQLVESGLSEGLLEEAPQSAVEQMLQNYALDKPIMDGVGNAAAMGLLAGVATGGAAGGYNAAAEIRNTLGEKKQNDDGTLTDEGTTTADPVADPVQTSPDAKQPTPPQDTEQRIIELELAATQRDLSPQEAEEYLSLSEQFDAQDNEQAAAATSALEPTVAQPGPVQQTAPVPAQPEPMEKPAEDAQSEQAQTQETGIPVGVTANQQSFSGDALAAKKALYAALKQTGAPDDVAASSVINFQQKADNLGAAMNVWRSKSGALGIVPATDNSPFKDGELIATLQPSSASAKEASEQTVQPEPATQQQTQAAAEPAAAPAQAAQPLPPGMDANLQNRDRSRQGSVIQMAEIAKNPDYMRLGPSRTPDSGAPMVFAVGDDFMNIPAENMGAQDVAVMSDGQRVPFRYAVVEASRVQPSNFVDGSVNPDFQAEVPGTVKALNNGRTAGIRGAYEQGTAGNYQAELLADAPKLGIDPQVIQRTKNPMLVRVYSERDNTNGMAAKSQGQGLGMSPGELARQDAPLLDTQTLSDYRPGDVASADNRDFVRGFIGRLQDAGQDIASMMTGDGQLSPQGKRRIEAALMQAAYGDSELVQELFDSLDTDIRAIGEALKSVSGQWANMRDSARLGIIPAEADTTGNLVQAVNLIRKARRERASLYDLSVQVDLTTGDIVDPITLGYLQIFYPGQYMTRPAGRDKVASALQDYATAASGLSAGPDMFGDTITPQQIIESIIKTEALPDVSATTASTEPTESQGQPFGSVPAGNDTDEASRQGQPAGNEAQGTGPAKGSKGKPGPRKQPAGASDQESSKTDSQDQRVTPGQADANSRLLSGDISISEYLSQRGLSEDDLKVTDLLQFQRAAEQKARAEIGYFKFMDKIRALLSEQQASADKKTAATPQQRKAKEAQKSRIQTDIDTLAMLETNFEHPFRNDKLSKLSPGIRARFESQAKSLESGALVKREYRDLADKYKSEQVIEFADRLLSSKQDGFLLSQQTPEELAALEAQRLEAQRQAREAEQKAQADSLLDDFRLSGSDRPVDLAEAAGQRNIFDQPVTSESNEQDYLVSGVYRSDSKRTASITVKAESREGAISKARELDWFVPKESSPIETAVEPEVKTLPTEGTFRSWSNAVPKLGTVNGWTLFRDTLDGERFVLMTSFNSVGFDTEQAARDWAKTNKATKGDFNQKEEKLEVSKNTIVTDEAAEKARALLRKKLGQLNSGLDPEVFQAGVQLAIYHIERGARTFSAYAKAMIEDMGELAAPYLKQWYEGVRYDPRSTEIAPTMSDPMEVFQANIDQLKESVNVQPASQSTESNRQQADETQVNEGTVPNVGGGAKRGARSSSQNSGQAGNRRDGDSGVPDRGATADGKRSDSKLFADPGGFQSNNPGSNQSAAGATDGAVGVESESTAGGSTEQLAGRVATLEEKIALQRKAEKIPVKFADKASIDETLPLLLDGQREDVLFAEKRWTKPNGYGALFTNGTGTGKTLLALGSIKRLEKMGKGNIIVVVPNEAVVNAWVNDAKKIGLNITPLESTSTSGTGIVITTYANFGQNDELAKRDWDAVVMDEAHSLMQNSQAEDTRALDALRAITLHPEGWADRAKMQNRELVDRMAANNQKIEGLRSLMNNDDTMEVMRAEYQREISDLETQMLKDLQAWRKAQDDAKQFVADNQGEKRPRALFLSATPFAYEKNVRWAEGYLFEFGQKKSQAYNAPDGYEQFMITHFGYRMRYNKLTEPDAKVDRDLMQRNFNTWLRKEGVLSTRLLDVEADYERKFVLISGGIGQKIDEGLDWLRTAENGRYSFLHTIVEDKFDRLTRMRLLEAIKARAAVDYIKKHHELGRKVVVFYDYNVGGGSNVFDMQQMYQNMLTVEADPQIPEDAKYADVPAKGQGKVDYRSTKTERVLKSTLVKEFMDARRDLQTLNFADYGSPLRTLLKNFPGAGVYNGMPEYKKTRIQAIRDFNDDDQPNKNLLLVQKAANAGWSGHDTTGKNQRVLINLGLPTAPIESIQQEGRIYRTGQVTDAIFQYFNTGTNWERRAFGSVISRRAGTAENLAMGEQARGLREAFIQAFENSDPDYTPNTDEGKGGKKADRELVSAITEFDRAKALYYAQQKKTSKNKAAEGKDYFATPEPVGLKMVEFADIRFGESVLEPSAGHGAIARWFPEATDRTMIEPSAELGSRLSLATEGKIIDDVFENHNIVNKYDAIVMNPPFGVGGKTAIEHLDKATRHLRDGGRVVALIPEGPAADKRFEQWLYAQDEKGKRANEDLVLVANISLANGVFERAATNVKTRIVVIEKLSNPEDRARVRQSNLDFSNRESVEEIFDSFEQLSIAPRLKQEQEAVPANAPVRNSTREADVAAREAEKVAQENGVIAQTKEDIFFEPKDDKLLTNAPVVKVTTAKGKELEGVLIPNATLAKQIDKFTYAPFGRSQGFFVRLRHVERPQRPAVDDDRSTMFSRSGSPKGLSVAAIERAAKNITSKWANAPQVIVVSSLQDPKVPQEVRDLDSEQRANGATGTIPAFYHKGNVYLVADGITSPREMVKALYHESLGHYGLRSVFGKQLDPLLMQLYQARPELMKAKAKEYGLDLSTQNGKLEAAEEVLARMSETDPQLGFVRRAIAIIRKWIRDNLPLARNLKLSDDEIIATFLVPARDWVKNGGRTGAPGQKTTVFDPASRMMLAEQAPKPQTETPEFKRWFGDWQDPKAFSSRAKGPVSMAFDFYANKPMVLYHATMRDFNQFKVGQPTVNSTTFGDMDTERYGIFTTPDVDFAETYLTSKPGANVMPVYMSVMSPIDMRGGIDETVLSDIAQNSNGKINQRDFYNVKPSETWQFFDGDFGKNFVEAAKAAGYDGAIIKEYSQTTDREHDVYVAFDPTQIKSATGNIGTFDPENSDIRFNRVKNDGVSKALQEMQAAEDALTEIQSGDANKVTLDQWMAISDRTLKAKKALVSELEKVPDDGFILEGKASGGRSAILSRSAQQQGKWQITRFDSNGEPWGDTNYNTKAQAIRDFIEETDPKTVTNGDDIRFNRTNLNGNVPPTPGPKQQNKYTAAKAKLNELLSPKNIDALIYNIQDRFIDLKRIRDRIKDIGGTLSDLNDAYLGEELYHKRLGKRVEKFMANELKPLLAELRAKSVAVEDFEKFLHARHAPEANKVLSERNPNQAMINQARKEAADTLKDLQLQLQRAKASGTATKGIEEALSQAQGKVNTLNTAQAFKGTEAERLSLSGMSDEDAAKFMASLSPAKKTAMQALSAKVDAMNDKTLQTLEQYGLETKANLDKWRGQYKHYVPLHRDEAHPDTGSHPIGQGFSTKGSAAKSRTGSNAKVTNILAHIAMQREAALTRGEKNRVAKQVYLLASQNPDANTWLADKPPTVKTVDPNTGFVRTGIDPTYRNKPNVLMVRIAGKDRAIVFNEQNPQAVRAVGALKNLDMSDMGVVVGVVQKATRWFASINTQYNPVFGLINFARDVQSAMLNLSTTPLAGKQKEIAKNLGGAMRAIYRDTRGKPSANNENAQWMSLWDEMQMEGGATGYRELFANAEDRAKALTKEIEAMDRGAVKKAASAVVDWLSDYNEVMENAVRVAAYKVALDQGLTKPRAASLAKNLTVNFNRKGSKAQSVGAFYAFFNAAVQGTARMAETLTGPAGRKIMYGGVGIGMASSMIAMAMMGGLSGDDDEDNYSKIPDFVRERSLIIPLSSSKYIAIPMPLGFHVIPNMGRKAMEMAFGKETKSKGSHLVDLAVIVSEAFNPVGSASSLTQMIAPTVADPIVALAENRDWTGAPIYREDMSNLDPTPGFTRTKDTASAISKYLAEVVNNVTGGTDYMPGMWSPTPDQIDYVIGQLTGGVGREALKIIQTTTAPVTGEDLPANKIPVLGRIYGSTDGASGQSGKFYENLRELNILENEIKGRGKDGGNVAEFLAENPEAKLVNLGNALEKQVRVLRQAKRREIEKAEPGYRDKVKAYDLKIEQTMKRLNKEVEDARN